MKYQKVASSTVLTYAPPAMTRPSVAPVNNLPYIFKQPETTVQNTLDSRTREACVLHLDGY